VGTGVRRRIVQTESFPCRVFRVHRFEALAYPASGVARGVEQRDMGIGVEMSGRILCRRWICSIADRPNVQVGNVVGYIGFVEFA
jgi:hypothetical protein